MEEKLGTQTEATNEKEKKMENRKPTITIADW